MIYKQDYHHMRYKEFDGEDYCIKIWHDAHTAFHKLNPDSQRGAPIGARERKAREHKQSITFNEMMLVNVYLNEELIYNEKTGSVCWATRFTVNSNPKKKMRLYYVDC